MKKIVFITTVLMVISCFGQPKSQKGNGLKITNPEISHANDTIINVVYKNKSENNKNPAYFINGKLAKEWVLKSLNPKAIATVKVEKKDFEIDNVTYCGKIMIETKSDYNPKLISLNNLKTKYTNLNENFTLFKIDDEIIHANYDDFMVDEKYILKIVVENFENKEANLIINFVNIVSKSEENIKKSKEIILR